MIGNLAFGRYNVGKWCRSGNDIGNWEQILVTDKSSGVAPYPLALILCDQVWQDRATEKRSLLGCFSVIAGEKFPLVHPEMAVYVAVTDCRGRVNLRLRLIDADEERPPLFESEAEYPNDVADPRMVLEFHLSVPPLEFPQAGEYRMQLFAGAEFLLERRVVVVPRDELLKGQS